ncbi:MAG: hypothetical protein JNM68_05090, partial [Dinghuibacter sp.]|nr:hypothetical protein [Dinghuibacter sp.]
IFVKFMRTDGIDNDHFTLTSSYMLPNGRMFFGSTNQFVSFNPVDIKLNTRFPEVVVTDCSLMNIPLRVDSLLQLDRVELAYKDNSLVIGLSTLQFISTHLIRYKLDGFDKNWKQADRNGQAVYSYLPPGRYTLLLKTVNEEGVESPVQQSFRIWVRAPFWRTWWFYGAVALLLFGLLYWYDRERMNRKESLLKMRSNIALSLHDDINVALSNINILSEMARIKTDKEPGKSVEFIEQIHSKSRQMMVAMDDMLWSLSPENDSMEKTVLRMKEYIEELNNREGTRIAMQVDKHVTALKLDMQFRHEAYSLFKTGLSALVKAGVTDSQVDVGIEKNALMYNIVFSNDCCNAQQMTNLMQSQVMAGRLDAVGATIQVEEQKTNSMLTIRVPVKG